MWSHLCYKHHGKDAAFYLETRIERQKCQRAEGNSFHLSLGFVFFFFMLEFNEERIEMFKKAVPHMKAINSDNMSVNYARNLEIEASVS